jgi:hypothetical protein
MHQPCPLFDVLQTGGHQQSVVISGIECEPFPVRLMVEELSSPPNHVVPGILGA